MARTNKARKAANRKGKGKGKGKGNNALSDPLPPQVYRRGERLTIKEKLEVQMQKNMQEIEAEYLEMKENIAHLRLSGVEDASTVIDPQDQLAFLLFARAQIDAARGEATFFFPSSNGEVFQHDLLTGRIFVGLDRNVYIAGTASSGGPFEELHAEDHPTPEEAARVEFLGAQLMMEGVVLPPTFRQVVLIALRLTPEEAKAFGVPQLDDAASTAGTEASATLANRIADDHDDNATAPDVEILEVNNWVAINDETPDPSSNPSPEQAHKRKRSDQAGSKNKKRKIASKKTTKQVTPFVASDEDHVATSPAAPVASSDYQAASSDNIQARPATQAAGQSVFRVSLPPTSKRPLEFREWERPSSSSNSTARQGKDDDSASRKMAKATGAKKKSSISPPVPLKWEEIATPTSNIPGTKRKRTEEPDPKPQRGDGALRAAKKSSKAAVDLPVAPRPSFQGMGPIMRSLLPRRSARLSSAMRSPSPASSPAPPMRKKAKLSAHNTDELSQQPPTTTTTTTTTPKHGKRSKGPSGLDTAIPQHPVSSSPSASASSSTTAPTPLPKGQYRHPMRNVEGPRFRTLDDLPRFVANGVDQSHKFRLPCTILNDRGEWVPHVFHYRPRKGRIEDIDWSNARHMKPLNRWPMQLANRRGAAKARPDMGAQRWAAEETAFLRELAETHRDDPTCTRAKLFRLFNERFGERDNVVTLEYPNKESVTVTRRLSRSANAISSHIDRFKLFACLKGRRHFGGKKSEGAREKTEDVSNEETLGGQIDFDQSAELEGDDSAMMYENNEECEEDEDDDDDEDKEKEDDNDEEEEDEEDEGVEEMETIVVEDSDEEIDIFSQEL
ncbi:hypothetical protein SLS57_012419 [Botryosphaeria dothidea]